MHARRIAVVGSASGSGKTTLARTLATRLGATFIEFDSHLHGPNWTTTPADVIRAQLAPIIAGDTWVIDTLAEGMLGPLIVDAVDLVVWLDLPPWVWLPRLVRRSARRWLSREPLWNGNRETFRGLFLERDGLFPHALRSYFRRRTGQAMRLADHVARRGQRIIRLCTVDEVAAFVAAFEPPAA